MADTQQNADLAFPVERRAHPRVHVSRPCAVMREGVRSITSARTVDVSRSGALLLVTSARPLEAGETLRIGVSWAGQAVVRRDAMPEARVVRATAPDDQGEQTVAVHLDKPLGRLEPIVPAPPKLPTRAERELRSQDGQSRAA